MLNNVENTYLSFLCHVKVLLNQKQKCKGWVL